MPISTDLRNRCVTRSVNLSNIEPENERKTINQLQTLFSELIKLPECQWLEFKHNNEDPEMIGEDISALANSAALEGDHRRILFGV